MKKYRMVKMAALLCAAALGVTGCGQKKNEKLAFETKLDTKEQVTLDTAGFFGNFEALDQVIADFNQYYPNVEFAYEQVGIDNFSEYMEANSNVDIMMTSEEIFEKCGDLVIPLCADLKEAGVATDDMDPKMLQRGYHDGKLTCIPMGQNIYGMVVNVSLLEKEGLKVPETYEEFLSVLSALKEKGYTPIQGPNSKVYAELTEGMAYDLILNDKELAEALVSGDKSAVEKLQPVYDILNEITENGYIDASVNENYPNDNYDQAILNFFEGDVPFWVCNTEKVSGMKKRESKSEAFQKNPFTYTFIYPPLGEKGVYAYREPWFGFSVNNNAENYDYAVEFLRFLATKDEINTIASIKGIPSVAVESTDLEIYQNVLNPAKVEMEEMNEGTITATMESDWYTTVNGYIAGEYATEQEALESFVEGCGEN